MNTRQMIEVMQAFVDGKKIECKYQGTVPGKDWLPSEDPIWDWDFYEYRVAPEPKKEGRWERKSIRIFDGEYAIIWEDHDSGDELIHLSRMISTPGFGGIDYRSPFDEKVVVRSMVPLMFSPDPNSVLHFSVGIKPDDRPGIPVAAWFWREGEK